MPSCPSQHGLWLCERYSCTPVPDALTRVFRYFCQACADGGCYAPSPRGHFGTARPVCLSVLPSVCPTAQLPIGTLAACSLATAGHHVRTVDPSGDGRRSDGIFNWRRNDICHRRTAIGGGGISSRRPRILYVRVHCLCHIQFNARCH